MTATITWPKTGRGAWNAKGVGGTLSLSGTKPGAYFRTPAEGSNLPRIGLVGANAVRDTKKVAISIDDYVVYRAVIAVQKELKRLGHNVGAVDGIWGPLLDAAIKEWQGKQGIKADGIYGETTAKTMWRPYVDKVVADQKNYMDYLDPVVQSMLHGHIALESNWDIAAVGVVNPHDVGFLQVNLDAHTDLTIDQATEPKSMATWAYRFVLGNLEYSGWVVDDAIACYNAGRAGAESWVKAGRPKGTVANYVALVKKNM